MAKLRMHRGNQFAFEIFIRLRCHAVVKGIATPFCYLINVIYTYDTRSNARTIAVNSKLNVIIAASFSLSVGQSTLQRCKASCLIDKYTTRLRQSMPMTLYRRQRAANMIRSIYNTIIEKYIFDNYIFSIIIYVYIYINYIGEHVLCNVLM